MNNEKWKRYLHMRDEHAKDPGSFEEGHRLYTIEDFKEYMWVSDQIIKERTKKPLKMLIVGCGCGQEVDYMIKKGYDVTGIDLDGSKFGCFPDLKDKLIEMDMHELKFKNSEFDRIYTCHAFEHSLSPYIVMLEFNRVLRMGGKIFISIPQHNDTWVGDKQHISVFTGLQMKYMADKAGFMMLSNHLTKLPEVKRRDASQIFILEKVMEAGYGQ